MDTAMRKRTGLLCDQLSRWPSLWDIVRDGGGEQHLTDLLTLLGTPDPDPTAVGLLIDAVEQACARQGLAGFSTRSESGDKFPSMTGLPPMPIPPTDVVAWTCPMDQCVRVVAPDETDGLPSCAVASGTAGGKATPMRPYKFPAL